MVVVLDYCVCYCWRNDGVVCVVDFFVWWNVNLVKRNVHV